LVGSLLKVTLDVMLDRIGGLIAPSRTHVATAGAALSMLMIAAGAGWPQTPPPSLGVADPTQQAVPDGLRKASLRRHPLHRRARRIPA
jgi:hypothetical protein